MIATLRFDLSDPDDRHEHLLALRGAEFFGALWDLRESLLAIQNGKVEPRPAGCVYDDLLSMIPNLEECE